MLGRLARTALLFGDVY